MIGLNPVSRRLIYFLEFALLVGAIGARVYTRSLSPLVLWYDLVVAAEEDIYSCNLQLGTWGIKYEKHILSEKGVLSQYKSVVLVNIC